MPISRSFALRPSGPDSTYRRRDYLRGSAVCLGFAVLLFAISALAGIRDSRPAMYFSFGAVLLAALSVGAALIFIAQAVIGSHEPVSFALPHNFVPERFRDPIRAILLKYWNPQRRPAGEDYAYESYVSLMYDVASRNYDAPSIASTLEELELNDSLKPGSDSATRLATAEQLLGLFHGN